MQVILKLARMPKKQGRAVALTSLDTPSLFLGEKGLGVEGFHYRDSSLTLRVTGNFRFTGGLVLPKKEPTGGDLLSRPSC